MLFDPDKHDTSSCRPAAAVSTQQGASAMYSVNTRSANNEAVTTLPACVASTPQAWQICINANSPARRGVSLHYNQNKIRHCGVSGSAAAAEEVIMRKTIN